MRALLIFLASLGLISAGHAADAVAGKIEFKIAPTLEIEPAHVAVTAAPIPRVERGAGGREIQSLSAALSSRVAVDSRPTAARRNPRVCSRKCARRRRTACLDPVRLLHHDLSVDVLELDLALLARVFGYHQLLVGLRASVLHAAYAVVDSWFGLDLAVQRALEELGMNNARTNHE